MPKEHQTSPPESFPARLKRALLALLFTLVLIIPRVRRLRRSVWAWTAVRGATIVLGAAVVWRFAYHGGGIASLLLGIFLIAFGAVIKARPQVKSLDDTARELGALVALNGGTFLGANGARPIRAVTIFVHPERLIVLAKAQSPVIEIDLAQLQRVEVQRATAAPGVKHETWNLALIWGSDTPRTVRFRYEGTFAEHLARIAEETVMSVWKRRLPVLPNTATIHE